MKIVIIGAGAVGATVAPLFLANSQNQVLYCDCNPAKVAYHKANGITLLQNGKRSRYKVNIQVQLPTTPFDLVVIATKTTGNPQLYPGLKPLIGPQTLLLPLQNGLGNCESLAALYGPRAVLGAVVYLGAFQREDFVVEVGGRGQVLLGDYFAQGQGQAKLVFANLWQEAFTQKEDCCKLVVRNNIKQDQWEKVLINSVINPLTAYYDVRNGAILQEPYWAFAQKLLQEGVDVSAACGLNLPYQKVLAGLQATAAQTGQNYSSMRMDQKAGRELELASITDQIISRGLAHNLPVESHQKIKELLASCS